MRVAMLLGLSTGGIGTHVVELTKDLRALGEDVVVLTDSSTADRFALRDAVRAWPGSTAGRAVTALRSVRRYAAGADVLHAHGHQAGLVAVVATVGLRTPVVVSQHNEPPPGRGLRGLVGTVVQRVVAARAALVTGASSDLVEAARAHGARAVRLAEVPSPRVPELLSAEPLTEEGRRELARALLREKDINAGADAGLVLTIARIAPQKDLATLVDAAAALQVSFHLGEKPAGVWVVVGGGDPELSDRLVARARESGAPLHFVGPQDDPVRWLRAAEVFVLPSRWEARALVVQEAMAAGVPVVARDVGGLHDLVEGVGTLVPREAPPSALAEGVARYLGDPTARRTAADAGRERATSWDDGEATARRWREWYRELLRMT